MILVDTNLLTRMTRSHDAQSGVARAAIQTLRGRGERLIVVPQNLYEFWAATPGHSASVYSLNSALLVEYTAPTRQ